MGQTDVKCHMYASFSKVGSMGTHHRSKILTPWHYGDTLSDPWRAMLLLRALALWRARLVAWHRERDGRLRETQAQSAALIDELRRAHAGRPVKPLLGSEKAHAFLVTWIPTEVKLLLSESAPQR